jgi:hypothetical protein
MWDNQHRGSVKAKDGPVRIFRRPAIRNDYCSAYILEQAFRSQGVAHPHMLFCRVWRARTHLTASVDCRLKVELVVRLSSPICRPAKIHVPSIERTRLRLHRSWSALGATRIALLSRNVHLVRCFAWGIVFVFFAVDATLVADLAFHVCDECACPTLPFIFAVFSGLHPFQRKQPLSRVCLI